jgi:hypothetical protein
VDVSSTSPFRRRRVSSVDVARASVGVSLRSSAAVSTAGATGAQHAAPSTTDEPTSCTSAVDGLGNDGRARPSSADGSVSAIEATAALGSSIPVSSPRADMMASSASWNGS